jgi:hypothetical protein
VSPNPSTPEDSKRDTASLYLLSPVSLSSFMALNQCCESGLRLAKQDRLEKPSVFNFKAFFAFSLQQAFETHNIEWLLSQCRYMRSKNPF